MTEGVYRFLDKLIWTLFWRWAQCCAERPLRNGCAYCMRPKFHFGPHRTNDGEEF